jgi:hypothetical protein
MVEEDQVVVDPSSSNYQKREMCTSLLSKGEEGIALAR